MMALIQYARLVPGASRMTGTAYTKAPVAGDFWFETTTQPLDREPPMPGFPGVFIRTIEPALAGGWNGILDVVKITTPDGGGSPTFDFSNPANSSRVAGF